MSILEDTTPPESTGEKTLKTDNAHHFTTRYEICRILTGPSDVVTALSLSCSIEWDDSEVVLVRETEVVRREVIAGLSDVGAVSTVDGCWTVTVGHIVDEDRVPYVRINISHIQRERGNPGYSDCGCITLNI